MSEVFWCNKAIQEVTACPYSNVSCGHGLGDLNCASARKEKKKKQAPPTGEPLEIPVQPVEGDAGRHQRNITNSGSTIGRIRPPKLK
jgi:hypothetical protein